MFSWMHLMSVMQAGSFPLKFSPTLFVYCRLPERGISFKLRGISRRQARNLMSCLLWEMNDLLYRKNKPKTKCISCSISHLMAILDWMCAWLEPEPMMRLTWMHDEGLQMGNTICNRQTLRTITAWEILSDHEYLRLNSAKYGDWT